MRIRKNPFLLVFSALLLGTFSFQACDDTFNPIGGEIVDMYSIFGYLDAEADTQWVRIMPIRRSIEISIDSVDATITLRELGGQSAEMVPRLFNFKNIVGDSIIVWNYWTDMDIKANTGYQLVVQRPDGEQSQVTVFTPGEYDSSSVDGSSVRIFGAPDLVDLRLKWKIQDNVRGRIKNYSLTNFGFLNFKQGDDYRFTIDPNRDFINIGKALGYKRPNQLYQAVRRNQIRVLDVQLVAISAGPEWVDFYSLTREEISIQSIGETNIENGVGYFVGSLGKVIPFEICPGDAGNMTVCETEE